MTNLVVENVAKVKGEQSANSLFTCMKRIDFLQSILRKMKIYPRYYKEDLSYLKLEGLDGIAYPMKCFCDIFLNKLENHMSSYGNYGIALTKEWGVLNKLQPVQYINENSSLYSTIQDIYYDNKNKFKYGKKDSFHNIIGFIKPIYGKMPYDGGVIEKNFHDEKEWRYIPDINPRDRKFFAYIEKPYIINTQDLLDERSNKFFLKDKYGLKFSADDVRYIMIAAENERELMIDFIIKNCRFPREEKYKLISKITILNEMKGDW